MEQIIEAALRILAIAFGVFVLVNFFLALARTAIINRPSQDPILNIVKSATHLLLRSLSHKSDLANDRQRLFAWYMPIFIIVLIVTWFLVVFVAFAALYWAFGAETTLQGALVSSGSALTTLGFDTPTTLPGQVLAVLQGSIGLMLIVFILTFVPGYQSAVQARELQVAWLHRRLGNKPTGVGVLLWLQQTTAEAERDGFWSTWESWFRQVQATHVLAPEVIFTPSVFPGQSWVSCTSAMLDAGAIQIATSDTRAGGAVQSCMLEGIDVVHNVSKTIGVDRHAQFSASQNVTREQFAAALKQLAAGGVPLCQDEDSAWERFVIERAKYEDPLHNISAQTWTLDYMEFLPSVAQP